MSSRHRRNLLKSTVVLSGIISAKSLPETWTKPVVNSVVLPSHATTTGPGVGTCGVQQVAGGDTADQRLIEMGVKSGSFDFSYQTFSQQDRIIVRYGSDVLFDTGCVGAANTVNLNYSGSSTKIEVEVIPNCAGGSGTAWNYTVGCPGV